MKKIVIIGAGQLGSRHLQSLNLLNQEIEIDVIDPSLESLETAKNRFDATIQDVKHKISYSQSLPNHQTIDIAIIASTANS
ncbi:Gfo/Idh/MocA family oxidoreductase, partial [Legionella pneumophila]